MSSVSSTSSSGSSSSWATWSSNSTTNSSSSSYRVDAERLGSTSPSSISSASTTSRAASSQHPSMGIDVVFNTWTPTVDDDEYLCVSGSCSSSDDRWDEDLAAADFRFLVEPQSPEEPQYTVEPQSPVEPQYTVEPQSPVEPQYTVEPQSPVEPQYTVEPQSPAEPKEVVHWAADNLDCWGFFLNWSPVPVPEEAEILLKLKLDELKDIQKRSAEKKAARKREYLFRLQSKQAAKQAAKRQGRSIHGRYC